MTQSNTLHKTKAEKKPFFIFDRNKCVGCQACSLACINETGIQKILWRNVLKNNEYHKPHVPHIFWSLACNHCADAPCMKNCPAKAYQRDAKTGAVLHQPKKCIGCQYCTWACPYDAPKYIKTKGIIEKCTLCNSRLEKNETPACAENCPTGALNYTSNISSQPETTLADIPDIKARLKIIELRNKKAPETDDSLYLNQSFPEPKTDKQSKISALKELPLLIFTVFSSLLVAAYIALPDTFFSLPVRYAYMAAAAISMLLSVLHLGKKKRAWRAVLNVRRSWLSREILAAGLFYAAVFIDFFIIHIPSFITAAVGLFFLLSIDMLYQLANYRQAGKLHSAQMIFSAGSFAFLFADLPFLFIGWLGVRTALYVFRKITYREFNPFIAGARVAFPVASCIFLIAGFYVPAFAFLMFGELIDRTEFYNELDTVTPESALYNELQNPSDDDNI